MKYLVINGKYYTSKPGVIGCYKHTFIGLMNGMNNIVNSFMNEITEIQLSIEKQRKLYEQTTNTVIEKAGDKSEI